MCYLGVCVYGFVLCVDVDVLFDEFGVYLCEFYVCGLLIVVLCVVGIVICCFVFVFVDKGVELLVFVVVEDGLVVVLLFGGLMGVNVIVCEIVECVGVVLVIMMSGELCFGVCVFNLLEGYVFVDFV